MTGDLVFEIGTEELPASSVVPAAEALRTQWQSLAQEARIAFGTVATHGTPRRLALLVQGVADRASDVEERGEGPWLSVAFDAAGKPTRAAEAFAKKFGLEVSQLGREKTPKGERLVAARTLQGGRSMDLLPGLLARLIAAVPFRKSMRWGSEDVTFARPVRWILSVYDGEVVPVKFGDAPCGGVTYGHRFLSPGAVEVRKCSEYLEKLRAAKVLADTAERRARVVAEIDRVAAELGGRRVADDELVDTITGLVEWPQGVPGAFDAGALDMPREVLVSEMRGHQKYASVETADGRLLPHFVAVANTPVKDTAVSRRGYERVLRARLADARYFFDEDRKRPLASRVEELARVTFLEGLGSVFDKEVRIAGLADAVDRLRGVEPSPLLAGVAALCKADLTTGMVGEFPELQGVMGREYARHAGEPEQVAQAVFEHYLPRGASDALPAGDLGASVGLADRFDTLAGLFALGRVPTGAADPYGLRRACIGAIRVILAKGWRLPLSRVVDAALDRHAALFKPSEAPKDPKAKKKPAPDRAQSKAQLLEFFRGRLKALWTEDHPADVVEAVLAAGFEDMADAQRRLQAVSALKGRPDFLPLAVAFGRASNIIEKQAKDLVPGPVDEGLLTEPAEKALHAAVAQTHAAVEKSVNTGDYTGALRVLAELRPAVDAVFDQVLVMADDPAVKQNRLRLVRSVQQLFAPIADFARIQVKF